MTLEIKKERHSDRNNISAFNSSRFLILLSGEQPSKKEITNDEGVWDGKLYYRSGESKTKRKSVPRYEGHTITLGSEANCFESFNVIPKK